MSGLHAVRVAAKLRRDLGVDRMPRYDALRKDPRAAALLAKLEAGT